MYKCEKLLRDHKIKLEDIPIKDQKSIRQVLGADTARSMRNYVEKWAGKNVVSRTPEELEEYLLEQDEKAVEYIQKYLDDLKTKKDSNKKDDDEILRLLETAKKMVESNESPEDIVSGLIMQLNNAQSNTAKDIIKIILGFYLGLWMYAKILKKLENPS